jgi:branched-chain amino acid aminotransferase
VGHVPRRGGAREGHHRQDLDLAANVIPHVAKATGVYINSMLATTEAQRAGYREAILLNEHGYVADGPGENIYIVKDGVIFTPDLQVSILPGITRASIKKIAGDLGYEFVEKNLIRTDLYLADEIFMTGTAAEVTPLRSVDDIEIGDPGPVTKAVQTAYLDTVKGRMPQYDAWLDYVPARARA